MGQNTTLAKLPANVGKWRKSPLAYCPPPTQLELVTRSGRTHRDATTRMPVKAQPRMSNLWSTNAPHETPSEKLAGSEELR